MMYYCPKSDCEGQLRETYIGIGGDRTIEAVECINCGFYTDIVSYKQYVDFDC